MNNTKDGTDEKPKYDNEIDEKFYNHKCDLKIILLGDSAVGKSKLLERFLLNN